MIFTFLSKSTRCSCDVARSRSALAATAPSSAERATPACAIASIPAYVAKATLFWVVAPSGAKHHDLGHECSFATWARRGWCRLEQTALDISRLAGGRPLYVTHAAGDAPAVTTEDYVDRLVFGFQRRNAVLTGEFSCCRMDHQVALPGGQQVCIPCDKDRLKLVLRSMWSGAFGRMRPPPATRGVAARRGQWSQRRRRRV